MQHWDAEALGYCPYCLSGTGHLCGCPNEAPEEPERVGDCPICGKEVYTTDDRFEIENAAYHEDCFKDEHYVPGE